ncbi:MAG: aldehyde dehydrogenase family protein, partial [Pseudomonadota bacterium]
MALDGIEVNSDMATVLERQQAAQIDGGIPSAEKRIDWIDRCIGLLVDHRTEIEEAIAEDFGHRSMDMSRFTETASSIAALKFAKKHLKSWMRVDRRRTEFPFGLLGARSEVQFQPKGVVGIISPWNFPVNLTFTPLAGVIAAGNRAMIKPSEFTEHTSALMKVMFAKAFADDEISVFTGGPNVGAAFSALAFDHLIFTGATSVAKHVMRAAAENLVPLTLELGGKSPVILGASANMKKAANRILAGKTMNAGQICLAPDYAFVPASQVQTFIGHATTAVESMYPSGIKDNDDY